MGKSSFIKGSEGETLGPGGFSGRRKQEKEVVLCGCCSLPCVYENYQVSYVKQKMSYVTQRTSHAAFSGRRKNSTPKNKNRTR